jgi:hypothetical protein
MPDKPQPDDALDLTPERVAAMAGDPAAMAEWLAAFCRQNIPPDWADVQTTAEAGIATAGHGVLLTNADAGLEMTIELDADLRVRVDVSATKIIGKPLIPLVRYALRGLAVEMGLTLAV